ncbi:hypothetical protein [Glycomyces buryatensis]|uniref:Uncharacterized protein n=1 Tax=Glycomyces buryatensis TaxID=2570927 RepID=A0A4S8Q8C3_9ACTN|nr:hypothetical protein [Glycomyces buryatensis]THV39631.1 hypothetical protein FAB82_17325 [Glycomyces buryatensis]
MSEDKEDRAHWESIAFSDEYSEAERKAARRKVNRFIYQSMTYFDAVRMIREDAREWWDTEYYGKLTMWSLVSDITNTVALDYGVTGAVSLDHQGNALSDAYQIVLRHYHELRGWYIHPDFLD